MMVFPMLLTVINTCKFSPGPSTSAGAEFIPMMIVCSGSGVGGAGAGVRVGMEVGVTVDVASAVAEDVAVDVAVTVDVAVSVIGMVSFSGIVSLGRSAVTLPLWNTLMHTMPIPMTRHLMAR